MDFEAGDIFACYGRDPVSRAIQAATWWPFAPRGLRIPPSHVAIASADDRGWLSWWESTSLSPRTCLLQGCPVRGVQVHRIGDRMADYIRDGGRVAVYRLVEIDALTRIETDLCYRLLLTFLRRHTSYDAAGAALSGLRVTQLLRLLPGADLDQLFCSELIAAVLMRLNRLNRANPTKYNPGRLLRQCVYQGTYRLHAEFDRMDQLTEFGLSDDRCRLRAPHNGTTDSDSHDHSRDAGDLCIAVRFNTVLDFADQSQRDVELDPENLGVCV